MLGIASAELDPEVRERMLTFVAAGGGVLGVCLSAGLARRL